MLGQAGRSGAVQQPPVRLLGLDPGLRHTGWGVIDVSGNRLTHVADGAVHSDGDRPLAERLCQIHDALSEVLERYRPDEAAVEETFVNNNAVSTLKLGQARAVALLVPALAGLAVAEYANNMVKKAVVGQGRADKTQVQAMVRLLLPGCAITTPDAADALAVAICHAHHRASWQMWRRGTDQSLSRPGRGWPEGPGEGLALLDPAKQAKRYPTPQETERARILRRDSTDVEKVLWQRLRNGQLGAKFRRQEAIFGYTVDFVSHDHRLIVELDGGQHADRAEQDMRRSRLLEQAGFRVLRFWNNDVNENLEGVLSTIKARLEETTVVRRPVAAAAPSPGPSGHPLPGRERGSGDESA
ncbi:crossover junction endodeoxyribonuclease RuvC [Roseomonas genomospecies 6]|uniref:Crossover junction endodeoxyribonuclease RuvC n=2 Tax=Roseomonas genomospecies 6 TaxID=214106 RepID=A0A9W7U0N3_9PROT|nr:crossover junction endodeoxyribonuclease RuvC [Roseomonas genomospecies 6]